MAAISGLKKFWARMNITARLIIADDHSLFRNAMKELLTSSNFEIIAEAKNGLEAVKLVDELEPDLLLYDINMPRSDGMQVLTFLRKWHPNLKIIIITMHDYFSEEAFRIGANGYFLKTCDPDDLLQGIARVLDGETFVFTR